MRDQSSDSDEGFASHLIESKFKFLRCWILKNSENMKDPWIFKHVTYSVTESSENSLKRYINGLISACPLRLMTATHQLNWPAYQKYMASSRYTLVYSRAKDISAFPNNDDFTMNEINLSKVLQSYDPDHYSLFKPFQQKVYSDKRPKELEFDSRFQGGNLLYAFQNTEIENSYSLFLQNDTNSYGYNQWFYFSLKNAQPGLTYQFSIRKKWSFFGKGMKISVFSLIDSQNNEGNGWRKMGKNIRYQKSPVCKEGDKKFTFFSLSFEIEFLHQNDVVYLAMNIPYSYSRLIHNLKICESAIAKKEGVKWETETISHSICNNAVPYVTISSDTPSDKIIIILARQHPGETWSSFLMEELLYILSESTNESVEWLISQYTFKIFPMVNVDGVIYGNFRCDIGGFDLNRNWKNPAKNLLPQVFAIKQEVGRLIQKNTVECVLDFHGHSKQYNSFCYSCKDDPTTCRILPHIISTQSDIFSFKDCTFGISKYKQTTARAVIYSMISNENVLTIENSFYGYKNAEGVFAIFEPQVMNELSMALLKGLMKFLNKEQKQKYKLQVKQRLSSMITRDRMSQAADSGSDSDPSADEISIKQKAAKILPKSFACILDDKDEEVSPPKKKKEKKKKSSKAKKQSDNKFETIIPVKPLKKQQPDEKPVILKTFINKANLTKYKTTLRQGSVRDSRNIQTRNSNNSNETNKSLNLESRKHRTIVSKANEIELPFYLKQKSNLITLKMKNNTEEVIKEYSSLKKQRQKDRAEHRLEEKLQKQSSFRTTYLKENSKRRIKIEKEDDEQLPLLCIFSEGRRKYEIQKKQRDSATAQSINQMTTKRQSLQQNFNSNRYESTNRMGREKSLQEKSRASSTLAAQIWRETFNKYGAEIERGVIMGRHRRS